MKENNKHCWNCLHEENCRLWPSECVCEKWKPELEFEQEREMKKDE